MSEETEAFWSRVEKGQHCWEWTGGKTVGGYGKFCFKYKSVYAHRYSYELASGNAIDGLLVCHHCDNPGCVNPSHLFSGTHKDNHRDMVSKGRNAVSCGEKSGMRTKPHRHWSVLYGNIAPKGEECVFSVLTEEDVKNIRKEYAAGGVTMSAIAKRFGLCTATIQEAIRGITWKHVK